MALIYDLALIPAIFGLDWIGPAKMDPCPTLLLLLLLLLTTQTTRPCKLGLLVGAGAWVRPTNTATTAAG